MSKTSNNRDTFLNSLQAKNINDNYIGMFSQLTEYMDINYSVMDTQGNVILTNSCFDKRFPHLNKISNLDVWQHCEQVMKSGKRVTLEEEYEGKVYLSVKQPIIKEGKCEGVMVLSFDITAQKQDAIAKRDFVNSMSHDIRTPMVAIRYILECLSKTEKSAKRKEQLNIVHKSSEYLLKFLDGILSYSTSKEYHLKEEFDIRQSLNNIIEMVEPFSKERNIKVELKCPSRNRKIICSKFNFEQISLNLLTNAVKFTEKGKVTIAVRLNKKGEGIGTHLSFIDTGIGIEKQYLDKIFDKSFQRAKPSYLEPAYNGSGLGLSIVNNVLKNMQGSISVKSEVGKGSTFDVYIPA